MDQLILLGLKALADPIRYEIIQQLKKNVDLCACHLLSTFSITQPTLSFHMKKLVESQLVSVRKEGTWMKYTLNEERLSTIGKALSNLEDKKDIACTCNTIV
jgi:ArsR family transcriptional regulator